MKLFDLHCDTAYKCYKEDTALFCDKLAVNFNDSIVFEKWHQSFAIWIEDNLEDPYEIYRAILCDFKKKISQKPDNLTVYLMVENAALLQNRIERVAQLKGDGVKSLTLTWNGENCIGGGCETDVGLKPFGIDVIRELNSYNMGCDLSHLNKKSFYCAIEYAKHPYASHSCLEELCNHKRNLSLNQAKLIAQKGGIVGICFYPDFLPKTDVFDGVYQNIFLLLEQGMEDNISIGSDFDGAVMDSKLDKISRIGDLYNYLLEKSIPSTLLDKIFYKNALNFYTKL